MSREKRLEYSNQADEHRSQSEFETAGDYYSWAGFEGLGESELSREGAGQFAVSDAIGCMQRAALCYRLADDLERCQLRCRQGIVVAEELRKCVFDEDPEKGLADEYEGDFRVIGDLPGYEDAYMSAGRHYESVPYNSGWEGETEFVTNYELFDELIQATDHEVPAYLDLEFGFPQRIAYKNAEFPTIVQELLDQGTWPESH